MPVARFELDSVVGCCTLCGWKEDEKVGGGGKITPTHFGDGKMKKKCPRCTRELDLINFYKVKSNKAGLYTYCKECAVKDTQHRQKSAVKFSVVEKKCGMCQVVKSSSDFYKNNYYANGLSQYCKDCRKKYESSPLRHQQAAEGMKRLRAFYKTKPFEVAWWRNRMSGTGFLGLSSLDVMKKFERCKDCCYCGVDLRKNPEICSLDHLLPKSRGGKNEIDNIGLACKQCNAMKGTMTDVEFRAFLKEYVARFSIIRAAQVFTLKEYAERSV